MKKVLFLLVAAFAWFQANAVDASTDYIQKWGKLKLVGLQLSSESGEPIQLKGWSSFGFYNENCVRNSNDLESMKIAGANCVRIARYLTDFGSIDDNGIKNWMKWTNDKGMYCVIDWHILEAANGDGNPANHASDAQRFFTMVANEVKNNNYRHIIYELCNEPSGVGWGTIKSYAESMINTITSIDNSKPIVIVGTPNWDQYIYSQVAGSDANLIKTDKAYVMYAFHLYANEPAHVGLESSEFLPASTRVPIFVSEWGLSSAQPEKRASYDDVNTSFATTFLRHCQGLDGCGQLVSWMNWSYGSKKEGASTFVGSCGGALSASGKFIQDMLGGELKPVVTACYGGACFSLSAKSEDAPLNLGNYDDNPDKQTGDWASASGITYYDANNTSDEGYEENLDPDVPNPYNEKETLMAINKNTKEEREVLKCYAGRDWCNYRTDECVDLTTACIEGSWNSGLHNLGWVSSGEWVLYTFEVDDPGYYSIQMAVDPSVAKGGGSVSCNEKTGKCSYTSGGGFVLTLKDHASQIFMVDYEASTPTQEVEIDQELFAPYVTASVSGESPVDDNDKVWCYPGDSKNGRTKKSHGVLFKEAGKHVVKISFPYGHVGLGGLRFSYVKPWSGDGYPEELLTSVDKFLNDVESVVFPTVVTDGVINVAAEGQADVKIFNLVGAEVYSAAIEGASKLNVNLPSGVYSVEVASAEGSKFAKIIVK
ncbi:MAG: cellulase family glycosylhydrolase [Paludibacteraceae bacterium]|nr:cellulase family glycosylhydrolase [Paludibacteraceae bacterium]